MTLFMDFEFLLCFVKMKAYGDILPDVKIPQLEGKTLKELDKPQGTAYRRLYLSSCLYFRIHH